MSDDDDIDDIDFEPDDERGEPIPTTPPRVNGRAHAPIVADDFDDIPADWETIRPATRTVPDDPDARPWEPMYAPMTKWTPPPEPEPARPRLAPRASFGRTSFTPSNDWLINRLLPRQGLAVIYGDAETFKSFVGLDIACHVAMGWKWAGRATRQATAVYVAAEGAAGYDKRIAGLKARYGARLDASVPLYDVRHAPRLGVQDGDLATLIASIEDAGITPGIVVLDTLASTLAGGDENGAGMMAFVANATALANHFRCCVLAIHHIGASDAARLRGHTSLRAGVDVQILAERTGPLAMTLTVRKLKEEAAGLKLDVQLARVVVGRDEVRDDVSTLIVAQVELAATKAPKAGAVKPPRASAPVASKPSAGPKAIAKFMAACEAARGGREPGEPIERDAIRAAFMEAYEGNRTAKGQAFRDCEKKALQLGLIVHGDDKSLIQVVGQR